MYPHQCSERGLPVCAFVNTVKQPRGGFLNPKRLTVVEHDDNLFLDPKAENVHAILMGIVVDYLTRWQLTECEPADAFDISLRGATNVGELAYACGLLDVFDKAKGQLSPAVVKAACQLAGYDVAYRTCPAFFKGVDHILPDEQTVQHVIQMVNRSATFFKTAGVVESGMTFAGGYTRRVTNGDADYLSADTLWDMKVSIKGPTKDHTLQMLIYRILMAHSIEYADWPVKRIGFFNPRYNRAYVFDLDNLGDELYNELVHLVCD